MIGPTVKVRNKYIILFALSLLLLAGSYLIFGASYFMAQARAAGAAGDHARALAMYDRVVSLFPWNEAQAGDALYWSAQLLPEGGAFEAYLFGTESGYLGSLSDDSEQAQSQIRDRIGRLQLLLEKYPENRMARWHAPYVLGADLLRSGRTSEGIELLEKALTDPESRQIPAAAEELYTYYLRIGQYSEAVRVVETSLERSPMSMAPEMQLKRAEAYLAMGEYEAAENAFQEVVPALEAEQRRVAEHRINEDGVPARDLADKHWRLTAAVESGLERVANGRQGFRPNSDTVVRGSILRDGSPLAGIHVMLVPTDQGYGMVIPPPPGLHQETRSGADGGFEFADIAPGSYRVGLRLSGADARELSGEHLLVGGGDFILEKGESVEVEFRFMPPVSLTRMEGDPETGLTVEWDAYPGAQAYNVMLGASFRGESGTSGSTTVAYHDYAGTEITLRPFDFYHIYGASSDEDGILPISVAGFLAGSDEVWLDIQALDGDGRVISSLRGVRFTAGPEIPGYIDNSGVKRSEADDLLRERRYEEAITAYEADLKADPGNVHALVCLFQLYRYGTQPDPVRDNLLRDSGKAQEYGERLVELTGDDRIASILENLSVR